MGKVQTHISIGKGIRRKIIVDFQTAYPRRYDCLFFPKKDLNHPSSWHKYCRSLMHTYFATSLFMRVCVMSLWCMCVSRAMYVRVPVNLCSFGPFEMQQQQGHIAKTVHFRTKESSLNWVSRWWQAPSRAHLKCQNINQTLFPVATAHWVIPFSFCDTRKHSFQDGWGIQKGWGKNKRGYWQYTHTHTHTDMNTRAHFLKNQKTFSNTLGKEDRFMCSHLQEVLTLRNKTLSAPPHRFWGIMATTTLNIPVSYNLF